MIKKNIDKEAINLYWSPFFISEEKDWSFLYQNPITLFSDLNQHREKGNPNSYLSCPAMSNKMKKTLIFKNTIDSSYTYDKNLINSVLENSLGSGKEREASTDFGPIFKFFYSIIFFADQPLDVSFTSPYFHKSQYTQYGSVCPGEFNVGRWFRPYMFEVQMWEKEGVFNLKENEPIFYSEFKTTKPINLYRFNLSKKLNHYSNSCVETTSLFGRGQSLFSRYEKFKNIGFKEKILTEIKKNIIEEKPFKF
jgi:hypothetical protein